MPSRGRERGLLSSPTAAAGGRWVGSEGAGVAFMLRNRGPQIWPGVRAPLLVLPPKKKLETMLIQAAGYHARHWLPRSELPQLAVLHINRGFMEYMKEARRSKHKYIKEK